MAEQLRFPGFPEKPEENYWQYPRICNGWWHLLSGTEQKVLDYILRHTWGYKKTSDRISLSQFQNGITNKKTGEEVDKGIGIKRKDVILKAIKRLEEMGFIRTFQKAGKTKEFTLVTNGDTSSHQSRQVGSHQNGHTITDVTIEDRQYPFNKPKRTDYDKIWVCPRGIHKYQSECGCLEAIKYNL